MLFFTLGSSKIEVSEFYFFDTMITYNNHPRYVKHVFARIYVFAPYLGIGRGMGGVLPRDGYTTCLCIFSPWTAEKSKFSKLIFLIP